MATDPQQIKAVVTLSKSKFLPYAALVATTLFNRWRSKGLRLNAGVVHTGEEWKSHLHVTEYNKPHTECEDCNGPTGV